MRNIPDHYHAHARPQGGFFGHGLKRRAEQCAEARRDRPRAHDRPRHLGAEGRAVHLRRRRSSTATSLPVDLNVLPDGGVEQSPAAWWDGVVAARNG